MIIILSNILQNNPTSVKYCDFGGIGVSSVLSLVGDYEGKPCHEEEYTYI